MGRSSELKASLTSRAVKAAFLLAGGRFLAGIVHYAVYLFLALILEPTDFGLLGLVMIFIVFFEGVAGLGFKSALIHRDELDDSVLNTAFWASLLMGLSVTGVTLFTAGPVTELLGDRRAAALLSTLSLLFPVFSLTAVPLAILERRLQFKAVSIQAIAGEFCYGLAGIPLCLSGFGVWSLIAATFAQRTGGGVVLWYLIEWRPKLQFSIRSLRELLSYGFPVLTVLSLQRAVANMDYFVVSRWLGTEALGYYTLAFQLTVGPAQRLVGLVSRILFPAFAEVRERTQRLASAFLEGLENLMALLVPYCLAVAVLSPAFVAALYGEKWLPAGPPMQILAAAALFYGVEYSQALFFAAGRPSLRVIVVAARVLIFLLLVGTLGVPSIESVAAYLVVSSLVPMAITALFLTILLQRTWGSIWRHFLVPVRTGILLLLVGFALTYHSLLSTIAQLVLLGPLMLGIYALLMLKTYRKFLRRLILGLGWSSQSLRQDTSA